MQASGWRPGSGFTDEHRLLRNAGSGEEEKPRNTGMIRTTQEMPTRGLRGRPHTKVAKDAKRPAVALLRIYKFKPHGVCLLYG
jgi:hypothetical protein